MQSITHLQHILNDECTALLEGLPDASKKLEVLAEKNRVMFLEKVKLLGCDTSSWDASACAHKKMTGLIKEIEDSLKNTFSSVELSNDDSLLKFGIALLGSIPNNTPNTKYLSDEAIAKLLHANPPHSLLKLYEVTDVEALSQKLSWRMILASTRHTEDDAWQYAYLALLGACTSDDFENREIAIQVIDTNHYAEALHNANRTLKPWRMSHSKEAGVITFFTADKDTPFVAPLLTRIAVFLHYYYEVTCAGAFVAENISKEGAQPIGTRLVAIIHNHRDSFAHFTTPNVYDENLYWKHALTVFDDIFHIPSFNFFKDTASLGGKCTETDELLSLNMIDVLWDSSLSDTDIEAYFGNDSKRFLYHMQESLWYDMLQNLLDISPDNMEKLVKQSLDIGDITFTKTLIASKRGEAPLVDF